MLQGFQNIFICNFWINIQFYIDFRSLVHILVFEFKSNLDLNPFDRGWPPEWRQQGVSVTQARARTRTVTRRAAIGWRRERRGLTLLLAGEWRDGGVVVGRSSESGFRWSPDFGRTTTVLRTMRRRRWSGRRLRRLPGTAATCGRNGSVAGEMREWTVASICCARKRTVSTVRCARTRGREVTPKWRRELTV